jgi:WD40 repeat protein
MWTFRSETVCTLWRHTGRLEEFEARDLLHSFDRKSLLTLSRDGKRVSFHDLQHDFLRLNVDSLADAQGALIEAYRSRCADGWASGPNDGYFFSFLPHHLAAAGRRDELKALLASYAWIESKLKATDVQSVISDYDLVANEPDLSLQRALRLSIPALSRDWTHLPSQLMGRLREIEEPRIQALLEKASAEPGTARLCPQTASLTPPGPLLQTFADHTDKVMALAVLPDGRALSGSDDRTLRLWDLRSGESRVLTSHTDWVRALAVLPDGRALSGSQDWGAIVWDVAQCAQIAAFMGDAAITCVAATPTHFIAARITAPSICCGFGCKPPRFLDHSAAQNVS